MDAKKMEETSANKKTQKQNASATIARDSKNHG